MPEHEVRRLAHRLCGMVEGYRQGQEDMKRILGVREGDDE